MNGTSRYYDQPRQTSSYNPNPPNPLGLSQQQQGWLAIGALVIVGIIVIRAI